MSLVSKVGRCECGAEVVFWTEMAQVHLPAAAVDMDQVRVFRRCRCDVDLAALFERSELLLRELVVME